MAYLSSDDRVWLDFRCTVSASEQRRIRGFRSTPDVQRRIVEIEATTELLSETFNAWRRISDTLAGNVRDNSHARSLSGGNDLLDNDRGKHGTIWTRLRAEPSLRHLFPRLTAIRDLSKRKRRYNYRNIEKPEIANERQHSQSFREVN